MLTLLLAIAADKTINNPSQDQPKSSDKFCTIFFHHFLLSTVHLSLYLV